MKVGLRWVLAAAVALVVLVAVVLTLWPRHHGPFAPGPSTPRLVVLQGWTEGGPTGSSPVRGTLGVNDQGCLTLGGDVVVAQEGSRVVPDGKQVVFRGYVAMDIGSRIGGLGRQLGTLDDIRARHMRGDFVRALEACLRGHPNREVVQYWLAQA